MKIRRVEACIPLLIQIILGTERTEIVRLKKKKGVAHEVNLEVQSIRRAKRTRRREVIGTNERIVILPLKLKRSLKTKNNSSDFCNVMLNLILTIPPLLHLVLNKEDITVIKLSLKGILRNLNWRFYFGNDIDHHISTLTVSLLLETNNCRI